MRSLSMFEKTVTAMVCVIVAALAFIPHNARGQHYPTKPVRLIVPSAAGGGLDVLARIVALGLNERLGVPFVVDNRPGAGGSIGVGLGAHASPDGYTIIIISATHAATSTLQGKGAYDMTRDFAPIVWATTQPYIVNVNPTVPARSMAELIALAKAKPNLITYGSPGAGSAQHLAGVLLGHMAGVRFFNIPYKGGALVLNAIVSGEIMMSFTNYLVCRPQIEAGKLRALAVTTKKRSPEIPDLPAVAEVVPGYEADNWYGFIAPAKTPADILDKLHDEISTVLETPDMKRRLSADATEVVSVSRSEFGRHIAREVAKWGAVIREAGIHTH